MGITFDPINKYIKITSPTTDLTALELYNATMDWCDEQETISYSVPMKALGKFTLGGGAYTDSIFILQNGWKIKFWDGTYQATITGTLITEDASPRTVPPDSGNVEVVFQVSSQGTIIPDEAEWTQAEKDGIMSDVGTIKPKTDKLPVDPASESSVLGIKAKTDTLPIDPASELSVETVGEDLSRHDAEVKGEPLKDHAWDSHEASLIKIKEAIDEIGVAEEVPKSIAQIMEKRLQS